MDRNDSLEEINRKIMILTNQVQNYEARIINLEIELGDMKEKLMVEKCTCSSSSSDEDNK